MPLNLFRIRCSLQQVMVKAPELRLYRLDIPNATSMSFRRILGRHNTSQSSAPRPSPGSVSWLRGHPFVDHLLGTYGGVFQPRKHLLVQEAFS